MILALFLLASVSFQERVLPTDQDLQKFCRQYQERFGLKKWDITLQIVPEKEIGPNLLGNVKWEQKHAIIRILDRRSPYAVPYIVERAMKRTILHELIHLVFAPIHRTEMDTQEDDIIDCLVPQIQAK